jgi:short-subunit dehydrogenase
VDITSTTALKETATQIRRDHGHPTVLINNAGVGFSGTILEEPEEHIRLTLEVNTLSHFWTVKEFLPSMIQNDHGHIVTIASMASFVALGDMADYAASKAAALAFHESLTQEIKHWYGSKRVRTR